MGRYLESDVALPDGALTLNSMIKLENGNLRICYYSADGGQMYADSQDAGKNLGYAGTHRKSAGRCR